MIRGEGSCLNADGTHKQSYRSRAAARAAAKQAERAKNDKGLRAYRCQEGHYHVGHGPTRRDRDMEQEVIIHVNADNVDEAISKAKSLAADKGLEVVRVLGAASKPEAMPVLLPDRDPQWTFAVKFLLGQS